MNILIEPVNQVIQTNSKVTVQNIFIKSLFTDNKIS